MERIHMNYLKDIIYRLRCGDSERQISRDLGISRQTVHKYKIMAEMQGFLDCERDLPKVNQLEEVLGPAPQPVPFKNLTPSIYARNRQPGDCSKFGKQGVNE
jgi:hypothetical protein